MNANITELDATATHDLTTIERGDRIIVEGEAGSFVAVRSEEDAGGNLRAVALYGDDGEEYKLRSVNPASGRRFEFGESDGRRAVKGFSNVSNTREVHDWDTVGHDDERVREYIRS